MVDEKLIFIKEVCGDKVKIKEGEIGRILGAEDIPECFSGVDLEDPECRSCIIKEACELWKEKSEVAKIENNVMEDKDIDLVTPSKEENRKEIKEEKKVMDETKEVRQSKEDEVKEASEDVQEDKAVEPTEPVQEEVVEPEKTAEVKEEQTPVTEAPEGDTGVKTDKPQRKARGYITDNVVKMLKEGTTKKALEDFVDDAGYGKPKMQAIIREARKKGLLEEEVRLHMKEESE